MTDVARLNRLDQEFVWHPFTQQQGWSEEEPLQIERGEGVYLFDVEGKRYIDGTSSLWCNVHGHHHPDLDRAARNRWGRLADRIHREVCRNALDPRGGHFVQAYGSRRLDASLLLLAIVGFLPPDDPRLTKTVAAIERRLLVEGLVLRYETERSLDGLPQGEGAFLACSFWLADNYALMGRLEDARRLFRRLLGLCNDVGLLSEEYDPRARRFLGNFPQAFSHVALVNTAFGLVRAEGRQEKIAGRQRAPVARHD